MGRAWRWLTVGLVALVLGVVAVVGGMFALDVRRHRTPPRDPAAIEADWASVQPWLPSIEPESVDPALAARYEAAGVAGLPEPAAVEALAADVAAGHLPPGIGCPLYNGLVEPPPVTVDPFVVLRASAALIEAGHTAEAQALGDALRGRDLLSTMVGVAVDFELRERDHVPTTRPTCEEMFRALALEAACTDAIVGDFLSGKFGSDEGWAESPVLDFDVERLRIRDHYARLLAEWHPVRHDPAASAEVLERHLERMEDSILASVLTAGSVQVAYDTCSDMVAPRP